MNRAVFCYSCKNSLSVLDIWVAQIVEADLVSV